MGELTLFLVVLMAQAALVTHIKFTVQFWLIRKRRPMDWTAWSTSGSITHEECLLVTTCTVLQTLVPYGGSSGADQVDPSRVGELLTFWHAHRTTCELQQQPVPSLYDGSSFEHPHVTDRHHLLWRALRTGADFIPTDETLRKDKVIKIINIFSGKVPTLP